ncbi:hypothetical protein KI387_017948, partial [Taxus chinensis]
VQEVHYLLQQILRFQNFVLFCGLMIGRFVHIFQVCCRPANASAEAHNTDTALKIWDKTLELVGVPADIVERLIE